MFPNLDSFLDPTDFRCFSRHLVLDAKTNDKFIRTVGVYGVVAEVNSVKSSIPNTANLIVRFVDNTEATMGEYIRSNHDEFPRVKYIKEQRIVSMGEALQRARRYYFAKQSMCGKPSVCGKRKFE